MKLIVATRNFHKLQEIKTIFSITGLDLVSALDFPNMPDVVEDGKTLEENAAKKAITLARVSGLWAIGDDTGLEVDALGGAPGVHSARYAGEPVDYAANNEKLLRALVGVANRQARFRCVLALSSPAGDVCTVDGVCRGTIAELLRGKKGFGYDPLFIPEGHSQTFAEMSPDLKNKISHRAKALASARDLIVKLVPGTRGHNLEPQ